MDSTIIAAVIGLIGVILTSILTPGSTVLELFNRTPKQHSLKGEWLSAWGPLPEANLKYFEDLKIYRQQGFDIWATAVKHNEPGKKWEVRGRYDGHFLQMYYYPSKNSKDIDFLDYGCYFFKRKADGSFEGYSTGFGKYEEGTSEGMTTDFHVLTRKT